MNEFIRAVFEALAARLYARPVHSRLIVQPSMAILLGIRDGFRNAKAKTPLLWSPICNPSGRKPELKTVLRGLSGPALIARCLTLSCNA